MKLNIKTPTLGQLFAMLLFSIAIAVAASLAFWWNIAAGYIHVVMFFYNSLIVLGACTFVALFLMLFTGIKK